MKTRKNPTLSFPSMKVLYTSLALSVLGAAAASAATVLDLESANYVPKTATTGTWHDVSSSANNAIGGSTVITNATPTGQSALDFKAANNYFYLSNVLSGAAFTTNPTFTIFFVGQADVAAGTSLPVLYGLGGGSLGFRLNAVTSTTLTETVTSISTVDVGASSPASSNLGYHLYTAVYDGTHYSFYTDGVLTNSGSKSVTFASQGAATYIGHNGYGTNTIFGGQMAALVVNDTALSTTDIATENTKLMNLYLVPEPSTWAMLMGGVGMLAFGQRLRRRSH